jgi:hypothetical protein
MDLRAIVEEHGGVLAIKDELVSDGLIRPGPKLRVNVTTATLVTDEDASLQVSSPLALRFVVSDENHRRLYSFGIEWELAKDALQRSHGTHNKVRSPAPAFVDESVADGVLRAGAGRLLTMSLVRLEETLDGFSDGQGIRFELSDRLGDPLANFTVDWPLAFLLIYSPHPG